MEGKVKGALLELEEFAHFVLRALEADVDFIKAAIKEISFLIFSFSLFYFLIFHFFKNI